MRRGAVGGEWMLNSSGKGPSARTPAAAASASHADATIPRRQWNQRGRPAMAEVSSLCSRAATGPRWQPPPTLRQQLGHRLREPHDHEAVVLPCEPEVVLRSDGAETHVGGDPVGRAVLPCIVVPKGGAWQQLV